MRLHTNGTRRCQHLTSLFLASQDPQAESDAPANRVDGGRDSMVDLLAAVHPRDQGRFALHLRVGIAACVPPYRTAVPAGGQGAGQLFRANSDDATHDKLRRAGHQARYDAGP